MGNKYQTCKRCSRKLSRFIVYCNDCLRDKFANDGCFTCLSCGDKLSANRCKFCSYKCKATLKKLEAVPKKRETKPELILRLGILNRLKLLSQRNYKCEKCGYDKNLSALSFHHRDPSLKKFELNVSECHDRAIEELEKEASKCDLLCFNCHIEVHRPSYDKKTILKKLEKHLNSSTS